MSVAKKRILLVEDERELREVLALGLHGAGYTVDTASTVAGADQLLEQKQYALLIADWRLPDGNGIDLADRAVKLRARRSSSAVISSVCRPVPQTAMVC
jgi:two-component system OmpR family response regulator